MSMDHHLEFFDREIFDSIWALSWCDFQRKHGGRWATSKMNYEPGGYSGLSLRELICWHISEAEDSPEFLEDILARRTIKWTVRHGDGSQYFFLSELIQNVPGYRRGYCYAGEFGELRDVGVPISVATGAYLNGKIDERMLRAVLKLCGGIPQDWVHLSRRQKEILAEITSDIQFWRPLYAWQGERACVDDEWTTCLNIPDTRRFVSYIMRAWSENWPVMKLKVPYYDKVLYFRDSPESSELLEAVTKVVRFKRPSAFRQWY